MTAQYRNFLDALAGRRTRVKRHKRKAARTGGSDNGVPAAIGRIPRPPRIKRDGWSEPESAVEKFSQNLGPAVLHGLVGVGKKLAKYGEEQVREKAAEQQRKEAQLELFNKPYASLTPDEQMRLQQIQQRQPGTEDLYKEAVRRQKERIRNEKIKRELAMRARDIRKAAELEAVKDLNKARSFIDDVLNPESAKFAKQVKPETPYTLGQRNYYRSKR